MIGTLNIRNGIFASLRHDWGDFLVADGSHFVVMGGFRFFSLDL
jgi:hypothetical protein